jgi:hypothetical protein
MRAGYLFQVVNLIVSILSVPLLLRYLSVGEYLLWAVFTTFGTVTIQLQNSIQFVAARQIAYAHLAADPDRMRLAIARTRAAYRKLVLIVLGPFLIAGLVYLDYIVRPQLGMTGTPQWCVFILAFAVTYCFAPNNSILLGTRRVATNNHILTFTRVLYFVGNYLALRAGFAIMGICLTFLASQSIGSAIGAYQARKPAPAPGQAGGEAGAADAIAVRSDIRLYAVYMLTSYALYNGDLLLAAAKYPKGAVASYALALQSCLLLLSLAQVPLQVWLSRFVGAIAAGDDERVLHEFAASIVVCNAVFVGGFAALATIGNLLLRLIGSHVLLPSIWSLLALGLAFLVELNIYLLVNLLVNKGNYAFVRVYTLTSASALLICLLAASMFGRFMLGLILVPLVLQMTVSLPAILAIACNELRVRRGNLLRGIAAVMRELYRTGRLARGARSILLL